MHILIDDFYFLQIDESPLDGKVFDREALEELSKEGVTLVSLLGPYVTYFVTFFFLFFYFFIYFHL